MDPSSGYCSETNTFHSLRPPLPLPPSSYPISFASFAFSRLPSPLPSNPVFLDATTSTSISYPSFLSQVTSLTFCLQSRYSLTKGDIAFILSPATLDIPVLYFALLSLGVIVSPANPALTAKEIATLIDLSKPTFAFTVTSIAHKLPANNLPTMFLDSTDFRAMTATQPSDVLPEIIIQQSDPAAIMYSSGTTGRVKAAVITHRNLIASAVAPLGMAIADAVRTVMITVPLFHVYGFVFLLKAAVAGETAVIQGARKFDPRGVLCAVERYRVTRMALAPPALLAIVRLVEEEEVSGDFSSLQAVSCGGAPLGTDLITRFLRKFSNVYVAQGYGLTETTAGLFRTDGLEESRRLGSAGRLVYGCEAKIVDPVSGIAQPPGVAGELWVRGPVIMQGYLGDKESTSAILDSEGWLKTGDLCYFDNCGFLFVVDRLKELIKYKGYQVPPAELEHLLQTHPDIIEAAVIPYPNTEAGEVPVAFVVRQFDSELSEQSIKEFVAKQVAPYKRIHHVFFVDSIPKNAAGKILRKDLAELASSQMIKSKL